METPIFFPESPNMNQGNIDGQEDAEKQQLRNQNLGLINALNSSSFGIKI
jgi:hypothetical protein